MTVIAMMAICLKMRYITAANSNDCTAAIFISWLQAQESSGDFINDEPDESNSDAAAEVRLACASLRNRRMEMPTYQGMLATWWHSLLNQPIINCIQLYDTLLGCRPDINLARLPAGEAGEIAEDSSSEGCALRGGEPISDMTASA